MVPAARIAQWARGVAVRARLGRESEIEGQQGMSGTRCGPTGSPPAPQSVSQSLEVVAAVVPRRDGSFLLGQRPAGKVYAGYWEFPGGKVEPGEAPLAAI